MQAKVVEHRTMLRPDHDAEKGPPSWYLFVDDVVVSWTQLPDKAKIYQEIADELNEFHNLKIEQRVEL